MILPGGDGATVGCGTSEPLKITQSAVALMELGTKNSVKFARRKTDYMTSSSSSSYSFILSYYEQIHRGP